MNQPGKPATRRLFFALWPPEAVRSAWGPLFRDSRIQPSVPPRRRHLTLAYLGDMTPEQEQAAYLAAAAVQVAPFSFRLNCYGCFVRKRVVWMGCKEYCNILQYMVEQLREGLRMHNLPAEKRPFAPHMTLLRKHIRVPRDWKKPDILWHADEFVLVHSHRREQGLCYDLIGHWPLKGALP